jgi:acetyl esterase
MSLDLPEGDAPVDLSIDGPHGPLPVRFYRGAAPGADAPGLVWVHGGAFAFGDLEMPESDWVAQSLAERGISVVTVDYQLAPEPEIPGFPRSDRAGVRFPVASEEVTAAFEWTVEHADELGITAGSLSLGGASAGGNLAAGAALRLRDTGDVQPHSLLLAYPLVHAELPPPHAELAAKIESLAPEHRFPPEVVGIMNLNYVFDPAHLTNPYAFAGTQNLAGLPPTFILNSDADSLRSSGELFAAELASAGVDVLVIREPGTRHGHLNEPDLPEAQRSIERMTAWLTHPSLVGAPHPTRSIWSS